MKSMTKKRVTISLDEEVLEIIDEERNGIPRSHHVNKILKENLIRRGKWKKKTEE